MIYTMVSSSSSFTSFSNCGKVFFLANWLIIRCYHGWSIPRHLTLTWSLGHLSSIMINHKLGQSIYLVIIVNIVWYVVFVCGVNYSFQSSHLFLLSQVGKPPLLPVVCSFVPLLLVVFFLSLQS